MLGEDVLITGAGPDRLHGRRGRPARRRALRRRHRRQPVPARPRARGWARRSRVDPRERDLADVQRELGMTEGFDVGLEMSGNPDALRDMIANMAHGGRIAMLGIPTGEIALD